VPEFRVDTPSALCSLGPRPLVMTGYLVQLLRQHFADSRHIEDQDMRNPPASVHDYVWRPGNDSGIVIASATQWDPKTAGQRPGIFIKRNEWGALHPGINDQQLGGQAIDGTERFTYFLRGSHTLFCVAGEPGEAEKLGTEVYREIGQYAPVIRRNLNLHRFQFLQVGPLGKLREATDNYAVSVSVGYAFEESWVLRQHAPVLKHVTLSTELFAF
jgi:hypothetical protein